MDMLSSQASRCIVMASSSSILGKWEIRSCKDTHGFICQRKVDPGIPVPTPTVLPRGWVKLANDSYKVLPQNRTWPEARMQCEAEEGQLASTLDELSAAYLELQGLKLQTPLWIGLNRNETQGYFRWMDGWPLSMDQWAQDEPSRDRPCVYLDVEGTWKTALCNHTYPSVCKQSPAVPPTAPPQYPGECIQEEQEENSGSNSPWFWLPFRGHCYSFVINDIEWSDASTSCTRKGASLVSIEDPEELRFIKSNLEVLKDSYSSFWIGLYKKHQGQWKWLDQTLLDYINWAEGQPQDSSYFYGYMLSSDGTWGTAPRWDDKPYICKKPKVLPETPPTHVSLKAGQRRVYSGLAVVVVLATMCLMGLTALMFYKKTGRPLPSFTNPLVFSAGRSTFDNPLYTEPVTEVDPSMVDTSQLVNHMEAQPIITL
nr:macrophage mannose receptor 1-like isoform X1 [Oncorhynchus nerka]